MPSVDAMVANVSAEVEAALRRELMQLRNDVSAQRIALERLTVERNQWRNQYLSLRERVDRLCRQLSAAAEARVVDDGHA